MQSSFNPPKQIPVGIFLKFGHGRLLPHPYKSLLNLLLMQPFAALHSRLDLTDCCRTDGVPVTLKAVTCESVKLRKNFVKVFIRNYTTLVQKRNNFPRPCLFEGVLPMRHVSVKTTAKMVS
jgi:hypothetical protein